MLAELGGKLNQESTVPGDRLEDTLTDGVFGSLQYLPRRILGIVLEAAFGTRFSSWDLDRAAFRFWPRFGAGTEPDVVIELAGVMVIVEAKYRSPFSPAQLDREWRHGLEEARARRLRGPWLLAVTSHHVEPIEVHDARAALLDQQAIAPSGFPSEVTIKWIPWRKVAEAAKDYRPHLRPNEQVLVDDLLRFMDKRGVSRMFEGFAMEDYWLLTSAQRAAAERLYPAIARLVQELTGLVDADGLVYSNSSPNAIAHWQSLQFTCAESWTRSYFLAPYWPVSWSKPPKDQMAALFVMFNFWTPQIEVGFYLQPSSPAIRPAWTAAASKLSAALETLPPTYEVVTDSGGWTRTADSRGPSEVDDSWIQSIVSKGSHLRFHRVVDPLSLRGVTELRDRLVETRALVEARPILLELIELNTGVTPQASGGSLE